METTQSSPGKFLGRRVSLAGVGITELVRLLHQNSETSIYATSHPSLVVKIFDLETSKPGEVSYGPCLSFRVEVENFEDIQGIETLRNHIPAFYGSNMDADRKFASIAMEYLEGEDLLAWSRSAAQADYPEEWAQEFRVALYESLEIVQLFHRYGIVLIDFKPDNVIRLSNGAVKFVDLGAFFTPRHGRDTDNYVYSATPDYAELVIDTSKILTGLPLTEGSDIFSAGVGFFELATGRTRLAMAAETAARMLAHPSLYRFRDSQIRDVWRAYPHLRPWLPLVETQLNERHILFSEFWHLLKSYLAMEIPEWESLPELEHQQMLLTAGTAFIADQLPSALKWLADAIARATTLRRFRLTHIGDLMNLLAEPVSESIRQDLAEHNVLVQLARDLETPVQIRDPLNVWEVKLNPSSQHWAICTHVAAAELHSVAPFTCLKEVCQHDGHRFFHVVGDMEADDFRNEKLTLLHLACDHHAWVGA